MFEWLFRKTIKLEESDKTLKENEAFINTLLEKNFIELKNKLDDENKIKILIIGQPGAGKSSLLQYVTNNECTPKPLIGQRTDATDWQDRKISNFFYLSHLQISKKLTI